MELYHNLLPECPHSLENMVKTNIVEEEHAVLFTGFNTEEGQRLRNNALNCAVLDSTCSSSSCGEKWINN